MARDQGTMARRRQVRDSPRTLSGEQTRAPYSSAAEAAAETAVAREAKRHSDTGRDAENSSHGQVEYYSTVGSSPLGGSMSSGDSKLPKSALFIFTPMAVFSTIQVNEV